ncbi:MAG: hypothetical protein U5K69_26860 [Balneolaceae bacterium]|nr:hypothetical protein [Balneolaceae bacterium]
MWKRKPLLGGTKPATQAELPLHSRRKTGRTLLRSFAFVSELANVSPDIRQPYVGRSAFAHKGGVHVSAVMKNEQTYEHIIPEKVGNRRRVLVSDLSGKSNV